MADDAEIVQFQLIRRALDSAEEVPPPAPPDHGGGLPLPPEPDGRLPSDCPVRALGTKDGMFYYLDPNNELIKKRDREHGALGLIGLFKRRHDYLYEKWPSKTKKGRFDQQVAAAAMMSAASRRVWNPFEAARGAGSWRGAEGELVMHAGDQVFIFPVANPWEGKARLAPGPHGDHVYPAAPPGPRPDFEAAAREAAGGPSQYVLSLLRTWNWGRADVDPVLLLGWIGAAMLGGALDWRPVAWITGGAGTGKSTLHRVLNGIFDGAAISVSDATSAGVWQKLKYATLPVLFDEMEAEEDNRQANRVIKLARQAASGGLVLRGGADHESAEFVARSCFLFSSIIVPPLLAQDRSRMAMMELGALAGRSPPVIEAKALAKAGASLRRRLVDGWMRFDATLHAYRVALEAEGATARGADQFGTLLACADVLRFDGLPSETQIKEWAVRVQAAAASEAAEGDADVFLNKLLSTVIEGTGGGPRRTVGEWIHRAAGFDDAETSEVTRKEANRVLGIYGLKVAFEGETKEWLWIANHHQGLAGIFQGSLWGGRNGGATNPWVQAVRRLPGAEWEGFPAQYFGGARSRSTRIPLSLVAMPRTVTNAAEPGTDLE